MEKKLWIKGKSDTQEYSFKPFLVYVKNKIISVFIQL